MGAGISRGARNARIRRILRRVARELGGKYDKFTASGPGWKAWMSLSFASNGECFGETIIEARGQRFKGEDGYAAARFAWVNPGMRIAVIGYRGDNEARVGVVDAALDNRVVVFDETRKVYRAYLYSEIGNVVEVKS